MLLSAPLGLVAVANLPWSDRALPPDRRAELLLGAMTLREKVAYLGGQGYVHGDLYSGGNAPIPRLNVPQLNMNVSCIDVPNDAGATRVWLQPPTSAPVAAPSRTQQRREQRKHPRRELLPEHCEG